MKFCETQRFKQPLLWAIMVILLIIIIARRPLMSIQEFYIGITVIIVLMTLFLFLRLRTTIDSETITIQFFPIFSRSIGWKEIENVNVVNYGFVGGWGVRKSAKYGTIYNVKGSDGILIVLKSGKKITLGTQKPSEVGAFISSLKKQ